MGLGIKEVSEDEHQVFDNWLRPSQSPKLYQSNKRPHDQQQLQPLNCPRCDSINTKFCYYNNYNKTQPRHFCKSCKRHWTNGGTLRNVPVGGGRKNKRRKPSPSTTTATISQFSSSYQTMNIHHQPLFLNNDINNSSLMYNTESFINLLPGFHHNYDLQFSFSSSNFEENPSSNDITNSFKKVENMEESEVGGIDTSSLSSGMELGSSSYWNWNEFDTTVLVPDLAIPNWDIETEINP